MVRDDACLKSRHELAIFSMQEVGIGVDLGSTEFRVGVFDYNTDALIREAKDKVPYYVQGNGIVTQCSADILAAVEKVFDSLQLNNYNVCSLGVGATCSMLVGKQEDQDVVPFNLVPREEKCHDILFWMHSAAIEETAYLNDTIDKSILSHFGGKLFSEMAIPKLMQLCKTYTKDELIVLDLHRWLLWRLSLKLGYKETIPINVANSNGIAHDGELFGWDEKFYQTLQLNKIYIGNRNEVAHSNQFGDSCIDCYTNWFQSWSSDMLDNTLFVVAGTSTCCLYASNTFNSFIPGVWGPFRDILINRKHNDIDENYSVYEAGISNTGLLLEKLYETHPAVNDTDIADFLKKIENDIQSIESRESRSIHLLVDRMFLFETSGETGLTFVKMISGCNSKVHEDSDPIDLILRYVVLIETLAFQIADVFNVLKLGNANISNIVITGSQAKNVRMLNIVDAVLDKIPIGTPDIDNATAGVRGAYRLGKAHQKDISPVSFSRNTTLRSHSTEKKFLPDIYDHLKRKYANYKTITKTNIR
ncbi:unnamed protein product [Kluyveromyces dobzhanskii CBS 2104]|uniref:WGS project CCBQ000000000 data, contig MAT n=1 Tax=Kluyveromyces dobzhanskii CBS 2104 TaxID=1427455 RepID=A0A0A8L198_9SACH|nr:unnamed protein product [Kluyveromyces dobzhanskii CBS 2104]